MTTRILIANVTMLAANLVIYKQIKPNTFKKWLITWLLSWGVNIIILVMEMLTR